jgi:hypothetical protein
VTEPITDGTDGALARLEEQVTALRSEVRRLGAVGTLPAAAPAPDDPQPVLPAAYAWLGAVDPPVKRRPQVPRLLLEGLFLAAAATAAAIAELDAVAIAGVMVGAWVIVALIEWAASRAERRPEPAVYVPPAPLPAAPDPAWFSPPVEHTLLDVAADDNVTEVTRLPPVGDEIEATAERKAWGRAAGASLRSGTGTKGACPPAALPPPRAKPRESHQPGRLAPVSRAGGREAVATKQAVAFGDLPPAEGGDPSAGIRPCGSGLAKRTGRRGPLLRIPPANKP